MSRPLTGSGIKCESLVKKAAHNKLLPLAFGLVLSLGLAELLLRILSVVTADGAVFLFRAPCLPLKVPVSQVESALERYERDPGLVIRYDSLLGWAPRPGGVSADGMYRYNEIGARVGQDSNGSQKPGLPVALFGDSTMHGTGVAWGDTIGAHLEAGWGQGKSVQNFALGAYGMDQALLRWRAVKEAARPAVVIFGFQAENVKRNGSIFRALYTYETIDIPFSKPRFELSGEDLEAVNLPTLPPSQLSATLRQFDESPLREHDFFYRPELYRDSPLYRSRLLAFLFAAALMNNRYVVAERERAAYAPQGELGSLSLRIIRKFREEVEAEGARFVVVHLPRKVAVSAALAGQAPAYAELLDALKAEHAVIDPLPQMADAARSGGIDSLYVDPWHYSGRGALIVANAILADSHL